MTILVEKCDGKGRHRMVNGSMVGSRGRNWIQCGQKMDGQKVDRQISNDVIMYS